ncbi:hypothetical protein PM3016_4415 [Paenibacillus mucilaginosus 3016]|uniref:YoaT n=2 Tax=Paenibacillus mucilaginosus TaxID=61624 RepID=H6NPZ0_9BACL|nr:DUF817 domain-containing protein [Paenibacillus mucilaginosus]AFC31181.1 hypothetical protein PM3016_4415 [Paenibacillus mucilaginosus 3016]AFH63502.1 hypothetical protein B2K_22860 [Paenibacillus mucilaginosus K02]WFA19755.1 DUF817 domain-containing protein [Paenibacillus mucilaginosus]
MRLTADPSIGFFRSRVPLLKDLLHFTYKEALCCVFPLVIFLALAVTKVVSVPYLPRYDAILLICLAAQALMIRFRLETVDELKVITLFHVIGLCLELFKIHMGSWSYPGEGWSKLAGVPLYSGFMYASVASYICQAWKRFNLRFEHWPAAPLTLLLSVCIYLNFFTHHFIYDFRWILILGLLAAFRRCRVHFTVSTTSYAMPALLSFLLIGFFIWLAENISTYLGAWAYPDQLHSWRIVHWGKITSWFLLVIISVLIVGQLKLWKQAVTSKNVSERPVE